MLCESFSIPDAAHAMGLHVGKLPNGSPCALQVKTPTGSVVVCPGAHPTAQGRKYPTLLHEVLCVAGAGSIAVQVTAGQSWVRGLSPGAGVYWPLEPQLHTWLAGTKPAEWCEFVRQ